MFRCPDCNSGLNRVASEGRVFWVCPHNHGRAITLAALKRDLDDSTQREIKQNLAAAPFPIGRTCPDCKRAMYQIGALRHSVTLDVCKTLDLFDLVDIPMDQKSELSLETRRAFALSEAQARAIEIEAERQEDEGHRPDKLWKLIPAVFGLPVQMKQGEVNVPYMTYLISAVTVVVSIMAFKNERLFLALMLDPSNLHAWSFLSSFLLHAGWIHLISNMYFFLTFGDEAEHFLGHLKFLVLLVVSTILGSIFHILTSPYPAVGASGGIAGVLMYFALTLPRARIGMIVFSGLWVPMPAWLVMLIWIAFQIYGATQVSDGIGYCAHLGGALGGLLLWLTEKGRKWSSQSS